jgi:hypothetical protein
MPDPIVTLESVDIAGVTGSPALAMLADGINAVPTPEWTGVSGRSAPVALVATRLSAAGGVCRIAATFRGGRGAARVRASLHASTLSTPVSMPAGVITLRLSGSADAVGTFELRLQPRQVELGAITIRWEQVDGPVPRLLVDTTHPVAITLDEPGAPWQPGAGETGLVAAWWPVVEAACVSAAGARTPEAAASKITRAFYGGGLGTATGRLEYAFGGSDFASDIGLHDEPYFDCATFLAMLGDTGPKGKVDCADTTGAIVTFANAIGGRLRPHALLLNPPTAPVVLLAHQQCEGAPFSVHQFAVAGGAASQQVWDGCLTICGSGATPELRPEATARRSYLQRLVPRVRPGDEPATMDDQAFRPIRPRPPVIPAVRPSKLIDAIGERFDYPNWKKEHEPTGGRDRWSKALVPIVPARRASVVEDVYVSESIGDARLRLVAVLARISPVGLIRESFGRVADISDEQIVFETRKEGAGPGKSTPFLAATFRNFTVVLRGAGPGTTPEDLLDRYRALAKSLVEGGRRPNP